MATPSAQKLALKKEAIYQTTQLDHYFENLGFPQRRTSVCFLYEYESLDHLKELWADPEYRARFSGGDHIGFNTLGRAFTADVLKKIDVPGFEQEERKLVLGVWKAPSGMPAEKFHDKMQEYYEAAASLHALQKNLIKYLIFIPNNNIESILQEFGRTPANDSLFILIESETWDNMIQILSDADYNALRTSVVQDLGSHEASYFAANLVPF
ncbi:hypothetical protein B0H14DRAFT_3880662 [Mycena olivaceomarginata]|nr:hypothetical protein B0H14DRAFT_3880662 [Mycena olivaceomarginata]